MKIAMVHSTLMETGGAEQVITWLCKALNRRGHHIDIYTNGIHHHLRRSLEGLTQTTIRQVGCAMTRDDRQRNLWLNSLILRLKLRSETYDMILIHNYPATHWCRYLTKQSRIRIVWLCHEPPRDIWAEQMGISLKFVKSYSFDQRQRLQILDRSIIGKIPEIIANSSYTAQQVHKIYSRTCVAERIGIPLKTSRPKVQIPEEKAVGLISRLTPMKNVIVLLKALKYLQDKNNRKDICLHIAGKGPEDSVLKKYVRESNLLNVMFHGYIDEQDIEAFYQKLRIVAYLPYKEQLGLVPIEAGACGKVVITSDQGGPKDIVVEGKTGYLNDPDDYKGLAKKIHNLIDQEKTLLRMGRCAQDHIYQNYDIHGLIDVLEKKR